MLVLSRKAGQKVLIGDGIVVVVKRILGQRVTFGIEAPEAVRIVRGELPLFNGSAGEVTLEERPVHNGPWTARAR